MASSGYVIAIAIAALGVAIAVTLQRRFPDRLLASFFASVSFGFSVAAAFRLATGRVPPLFWQDQSSSDEPWERVVIPMMALTLVWPILRQLAAATATVRLGLAMAVASLPLLLALPSGASYADVLPANAAWSVLALLAIGANYLSGEQLDSSGASQWSLWVFVAQSFTVAALLMTCYGTLGEWSAMVALALGGLAAGRMFVSEGAWSSLLALAATTLSCILLTHIRIYSTQALPVWLAPFPMLSPVIVCAVDQRIGRYRSSWMRVMTAAATAAILAVGIIAIVLSTGIPSADFGCSSATQREMFSGTDGSA